MPSIKRRVCPVHGIIEKTPCEQCKSENTKQYNASRSKENSKIYQNTKWRKLREQQLKRHPLCINFDKCHNVATIADHITEVKDGGEKYNLDNLQSMCKGCHNTKTAKEKSKRDVKYRFS